MHPTEKLYALTLERVKTPTGYTWRVTETVRGKVEREEMRERLEEAVGLMAEWSFARALRASECLGHPGGER